MSRSLLASRMVHNFLRDPSALAGSFLVGLFLVLALFAPWIAPHNPYDLETVNLSDSLKPPIWMQGGEPPFVLGTDDQGREILSTNPLRAEDFPRCSFWRRAPCWDLWGGHGNAGSLLRWVLGHGDHAIGRYSFLFLNSPDRVHVARFVQTEGHPYRHSRHLCRGLGPIRPNDARECTGSQGTALRASRPEPRGREI